MTGKWAMARQNVAGWPKVADSAMGKHRHLSRKAVHIRYAHDTAVASLCAHSVVRCAHEDTCLRVRMAPVAPGQSDAGPIPAPRHRNICFPGLNVHVDGVTQQDCHGNTFVHRSRDRRPIAPTVSPPKMSWRMRTSCFRPSAPPCPTVSHSRRSRIGADGKARSSRHLHTKCNFPFVARLGRCDGGVAPSNKLLMWLQTVRNMESCFDLAKYIFALRRSETRPRTPPHARARLRTPAHARATSPAMGECWNQALVGPALDRPT